MYKAPLALTLALVLAASPFAMAQPNPSALQILIVEGDGAINNVKQRVNREPIVQVEDENHRPIAGAAVVFFLPNTGPGGTFSNASASFTTTTNAQGQASAPGIKFNNQAGQMQIRVTASFGGQTASTIINQTNAIGAGAAGAASSAGLSSAAKWAIIIAAVGGAAVAGGVLATKGGGGSSGSTTSPPVTLTPGTVTVGGPQ